MKSSHLYKYKVVKHSLKNLLLIHNPKYALFQIAFDMLFILFFCLNMANNFYITSFELHLKSTLFTQAAYKWKSFTNMYRIVHVTATSVRENCGIVQVTMAVWFMCGVMNFS